MIFDCLQYLLIAKTQLKHETYNGKHYQHSTTLTNAFVAHQRDKSRQHNNGLSIRVLDLLFHPQLHQIQVGLPSEEFRIQVCVEPRKQCYQRQNWLELS